MKDRISKYEIRKDVVQESVEAVTSTVGEVTNIIINAVKDVSTSIGGLATDAFAIRDGARRARAQLVEDEYEADDEVEADAAAESEEAEATESTEALVPPVTGLVDAEPTDGERTPE